MAVYTAVETRRCVVRGRVQGVGFRWFVIRHARELAVRGTVRNRADGTVDAVLQAEDPRALEAMIDRLRQGPRSARVEAVDVERVETTERFTDFEVTG
jgi:acylphosphatase